MKVSDETKDPLLPQNGPSFPVSSPLAPDAEDKSASPADARTSCGCCCGWLVRHELVVLGFFNTFCAYLLRVAPTLAAAGANGMAAEYGWSNTQTGTCLATFFWGYAWLHTYPYTSLYPCLNTQIHAADAFHWLPRHALRWQARRRHIDGAVLPLLVGHAVRRGMGRRCGVNSTVPPRSRTVAHLPRS